MQRGTRGDTSLPYSHGMATAQERTSRRDVAFPSGETTCSAWLYTPRAEEPIARIVMAHGLGGVRDMRLDAFAERFASHGYECLLFDYRGFGMSGGRRRQILDVTAQLADWEAAIAYLKDEGPPDRVVLFGTSLSGGHVLTLAARHSELGAAIAQCPYTDGRASRAGLPFASKAKVTARAALDLLTTPFGRRVDVALIGAPGSAALMATDDSARLLSLVPAGSAFENRVAARSALWFLRYDPGRVAGDITIPLYVAICQNDTVAPAEQTLRVARRIRDARIRVYPYHHFDIYIGEGFESAVRDYLGFLDALFGGAAGAVGNGTGDAVD